MNSKEQKIRRLKEQMLKIKKEQEKEGVRVGQSYLPENRIYGEDWKRLEKEIKDLEEKELSQQKGNKKKPKLKILACAVLNEDNPEFFSELLKKGVDAVEPEMKKQLSQQKAVEELNKEIKELEEKE
jgi:hypothetical protein